MVLMKKLYLHTYFKTDYFEINFKVMFDIGCIRWVKMGWVETSEDFLISYQI